MWLRPGLLLLSLAALASPLAAAAPSGLSDLSLGPGDDPPTARVLSQSSGPSRSSRQRGLDEVPGKAYADPSVQPVPATVRRTRFSHLTSPMWRYGQPFPRLDLAPVPNNNPHPEPQPHRDRPSRLALDAAGRYLYVTLPGTEEHPGRHVAVVDAATGDVLRRIEVGLYPYQPVLHPDGRHMVVTNELSSYASVIDTVRQEVVGEISLDFYCQGLVFSPDGRWAWVANRYLDQVLLVRILTEGGGLRGYVVELGGFDDGRFYGTSGVSPQMKRELEARGFSGEEVEAASARPAGGVQSILRARCARCHTHPTGGFVAGPDPVQNFLSAVENSVGGRPLESPLVRAVVPRDAGGFGDQRTTPEFHAGGALFEPGEPHLETLLDWIRDADGGPGVPVGNPGCHPKDLVLSPDGRHLFVANTGTMDIAIVDTEARRLAGALYIQNVPNHLLLYEDPGGRSDLLIALTMGAGFGAPAARDPLGAETWDRDHPAVQLTLLRDPKTTDPLPRSRQFPMGPFDAVDGTWNFKMRDIQNDIVVVDLSRLHIPKPAPGTPPGYLLRPASYEAHPQWVRYTSDTAEATHGDIKGDIPPELQRVHGAFAEWGAFSKDRLYITMSGSSELVEWELHPGARDPAERLVPTAVLNTGLRPIGVAAGRMGTPSEGRLFVANRLSETVSAFDTQTGRRSDWPVGDLTRPPLDTDAEKGELLVHTALFSSDGDTSCLHCHYRDTGDGRGWGAAETVGQDTLGHQTPGGTLGIPQMRNIFAIQPYYFEGTHRLSEGQGADIEEPASPVDFDAPVWAGDYTRVEPHLPPEEVHFPHGELKAMVETSVPPRERLGREERRNAFFQEQAMRIFGHAASLHDLQRYTAAWLGNTNHLLPNPFDSENPSVRRGRDLFHDARVMCGTCHREPEFTRKDASLTPNERMALPQLTTVTRRDASYTLVSVRALEVANGRSDFDLDPDDRGRIESQEGSFTTMQLRGIFDRPPVFLHHGRARSLREVLCTPGHPALRSFRLPVMQGPEDVRPRRKEIGFNETTPRLAAGPLNRGSQTLDTHGGTSHLGPREIQDLLNFMKSIP